MGFTIAKIIVSIVLPPAGLLFIMVAGLFLMKRKKPAGAPLLLTGIILLYLLSLPYTADLLIRPLEATYPPLNDGMVQADAIVVLSGGGKDLSWLPNISEPGPDSLERTIAGVKLARKLKLPLVFTGGSGEVAPTAVREAIPMADVALSLGIPREEIIVEAASRNTLENAAATRKLVQGNRILLVTSAFHMRRSVAMFQKQGFTVIPAPAGYHAQTRRASPMMLVPRAGNLDTSALAISERISLIWYSLTNRI